MPYNLDSINTIEKYVKYIDFEDFKSDIKTYQAVISELEIIGEATKNIYDFLKIKYPEYPWRLIIDMRNRISHAYFGINFKLIWDVILYDLPKLKDIIIQIKETL